MSASNVESKYGKWTVKRLRNEFERNANEFERNATDWKKYKFLSKAYYFVTYNVGVNDDKCKKTSVL